jgi:ATP-dependent exoDNAse (exonuclease V) beta subunit
MSTLIDQAERDRFVQEQAKNISVIAPAGVGKTTSIVARIVHIAKLGETQAVDRLSRLIVVTYSVRAAQQMQQKARVAIRNAGVSSRVQRAFQQTFFGTIHSYCVRLLDRFGHYLGLPSPVGLLQDDTELWHRFLLRGLGQGIADDANLRDLFHFYPPERLYALGKQISPGPVGEVGPLPALHWQPLLDYRDNTLHAATKKTIVRAQENAVIWRDAWARGDRFRPLPKCPESEKAADFAAIWDETFAPLHHWLREAALHFGRRVANAYEAFRLDEAVMTYDDQVRLALRALDLPAVRRELAAEKVSVLLDEAQDTDPRQFQVLQKVAGLGASPGQAADQTFCIVGDFQQAIYAPRSDLGAYRDVHNAVSAEPRGTKSNLRVTFRCDAAIIAFVNRIFPTVLNNQHGQSNFEPLVAREDAGPGQVVRWPCPDEPDHAAGAKITAEVRARHEAQFVAQRIRDLGPAGLGARDWSQVAVLCPRIDWLLQLQRELDALGLPVQLHSSREQQRDSTPVAWLTALIWIAAHPEDSFEIAGVLREILGVSDSDMAHFTGGDGDKLCITAAKSTGEGTVAQAIRLLREACAGADTLPLHEAVARLVEKTQLRERLESIEELALENPGRGLDELLALVAGRSAAGVTLAALAEEMRSGLTLGQPAEEEIRGAIQLLTSHKSKGLEWQAVIVPFVFRAIETRPLSYPRVDLLEGGREIVCRDKADFAGHARDYIEVRERQQLQRLLYVMATRARRTLVLVDDEALFSGSIRRSGWSASDLLGFFGGENRAAWKALPESTSLPVESISEEPAAVVPARELEVFPAVSSGDLDQAVAHASIFPRRTTPHRLAVHACEEAEPEARAEQEFPPANNPGILYGTWWHELVETIPWQKPMTAWQKKFAEAQVHSPQAERSAREWELFRQSKLAKWLAEPGRLIQVELPFLAHQPGGMLLEGVIDLAVFSEEEKAWSVIDWKTNRVGPSGADGLVEIYRGQIEAYAGALRQMLSAEVRGSLYLTQTGEWVDIA